MKNIVLKNGLIGAAVVSSFMIGVTFYMKTHPNNEPNATLGFTSMILAFAFVIIGIIQQRKADDGVITFGKAFLTGLYISLIIATIYVILWLIIYYNFFPDFMEKYTSMVLKNTKPNEIAAKTAEMNQMKEWYKSPIMITLLTYMEILPIGILVSLISALILKKKAN